MYIQDLKTFNLTPLTPALWACLFHVQHNPSLHPNLICEPEFSKNKSDLQREISLDDGDRVSAINKMNVHELNTL